PTTFFIHSRPTSFPVERRWAGIDFLAASAFQLLPNHRSCWRPSRDFLKPNFAKRGNKAGPHKSTGQIFVEIVRIAFDDPCTASASIAHRRLQQRLSYSGATTGTSDVETRDRPHRSIVDRLQHP